MKKQPKISVIIPVYNTEKYLEECLNSVTNQTLKEIEIICVDDGSTDASINILKDLAQKDNRIILLKQSNSGPGKARNYGLENATGEFVIFMDSDDLYSSLDVFETLYNTAKKNNVLICGGELKYFDKYGRSFGNSEFSFEKEGVIEYEDYQSDYGYTRFIFNREFLAQNNIKFQDYICYEDPVFLVKAMLLAKKFYAVKKNVYLYRTCHKKINWSQRRVLDALKGLEENLKISNVNNLDKLHKITQDRIYSNWFLEPICNLLHKKEVFDQFLKTIFQFDWNKSSYTADQLKQKIFKRRNWIQKKVFNQKYKALSKYLFNAAEVYNLLKLKAKSADNNSIILNTVNCKIPVSIIVPVYNVEKYLSKCLNSIVNQTHKNLEIICVNDGSTDSSASILEDYSKSDRRIKVIYQKNQGLSAARNTGIEVATSEYIMFVDSDDSIQPDTVQTALSAMLSDDKIDIVSFGANVVFDDDAEIFTYLDAGIIKYHLINLIGKYNLNADTILNTTVTAWNKLYKKSIIDQYNIRFPEGLLYEDNAFLYKYCLHAETIYYVNQYLYNYLQRKSSIMGQMFNKLSTKVVDRLKIFDIVYNYYNQYQKLPEYRDLISSFFNACLWNDYTYCHKSNKKKVLKYARKLAKNYDIDFFDRRILKNLIKGRYHKLGIIKYKSMRQKLFSIKKEDDKVIVNLLGLKIVVRKKLKALKSQIQREFSFLRNRIDELTKENEAILSILNKTLDVIEQNQKSTEEKLIKQISTILKRIKLPNNVVIELQKELESSKCLEKECYAQEIKKLREQQDKRKQKNG